MGDDAPSSRDVAAVIVTWNAGAALAECVASLRDHAPGAEVIVVDNASTDDSVAAAQREHPGLRLLANERNLGLAAGNNQGIGASTRPFVLISNPDVVYTHGAVSALVDVMRRRDRAAFVIARPERSDGTLQTAAGDLPTLGDALLGRQVARARAHVDSGFWWDGWAHDEERRIGRGLEASYLVRRDAIDEVGLQDERFRLDWEGIDWTERMHAAGWEVWFCPAARVVHQGGASIRKAQVRWVVRQHRGMYRYFAKRRPLILRPVLAVLFGLRASIKVVGLAVGLSRYERSHRD
jgi:GT2 family glycosyltransferase